MNRQSIYTSWGTAGALAIVALFTLVAWTGNPQGPKAIANQLQDTIPSKQKTKVTRQPNDRDLDYELRQLDNAKEQMDNMDWKELSETIQKSVEMSLKNIDLDKIRLESLKGLESVDFEKIQLDVEKSLESLKKIDFDKMQREISESVNGSFSKVDMEKIGKDIEKAKKEVTEELNNKDWKKEMEEVKKLNSKEFEKEMKNAEKEIEKAKEELKSEKFDFKEEMENASEDIGKAKVELKGYQEMIYAMESEGLLSTKEDYRIEYKDGELTVNGKKQSQEVTDKYKKYFTFTSKGKITIKKTDGEMHINHGNSNVHID